MSPMEGENTLHTHETPLKEERSAEELKVIEARLGDVVYVAEEMIIAGTDRKEAIPKAVLQFTSLVTQNHSAAELQARVDIELQKKNK